jgi:hypothetical protein
VSDIERLQREHPGISLGELAVLFYAARDRAERLAAAQAEAQGEAEEDALRYERLRAAADQIRHDAWRSDCYHRARAEGGMCVNHHPGYPPSIASRIVRVLSPALGKTEEEP